jgi:hypothetical protein
VSGPLALVGGDEFTDGCDFDAELVAAVGAEEVVLLATGSAYENPGKVVEVARAWFDRLGVGLVEVPVYTRPDALVQEHVSSIGSARLIYLTGTSPMHMRSVLKDTPVFDAICSAWAGGAALAGSGAGADVLCDPMVDTRGGAFTVGLGLLPQMATPSSTATAARPPSPTCPNPLPSPPEGRVGGRGDQGATVVVDAAGVADTRSTTKTSVSSGAIEVLPVEP